VVADTKLADFRLHDTHTFASRLAMAGVDLLTTQQLSGWKSLAMVQRYAHLSPSHRRDAIERLVTTRPAPPQTSASGSSGGTG
jgi:site-specific recombinase XerD